MQNTKVRTQGQQEDCKRSVRVAVRLRPTLSVDSTPHSCVDIIPEESQVVVGNARFTCDYAFGGAGLPLHALPDCCVTGLVDDAFAGYNAAVFAYGQTGSGKTFTMGSAYDNTPDTQPGIIQATVEQVFARAADAGVDVVLKVSFVEIYQDTIRDLLHPAGPTANTGISIRETPNGLTEVAGALEIPTRSREDAFKALHQGLKLRATAVTASFDIEAHHVSSRSHAIFILTLEQHKPLPPALRAASPGVDTVPVTSRIYLVDLAGSERTKRAKTEGSTRLEGIHINRGLLALGNVIAALSERRPHIPYRDSKLTRILKDALGGTSHTLMVACISPAPEDVEETINTLRYAERARYITNQPIIHYATIVSQVAEYQKGRSPHKLLNASQKLISGRDSITSLASLRSTHEAHQAAEEESESARLLLQRLLSGASRPGVRMLLEALLGSEADSRLRAAAERLLMGDRDDADGAPAMRGSGLRETAERLLKIDRLSQSGSLKMPARAWQTPLETPLEEELSAGDLHSSLEQLMLAAAEDLQKEVGRRQQEAVHTSKTSDQSSGTEFFSEGSEQGELARPREGRRRRNSDHSDSSSAHLAPNTPIGEVRWFGKRGVEAEPQEEQGWCWEKAAGAVQNSIVSGLIGAGRPVQEAAVHLVRVVMGELKEGGTDGAGKDVEEAAVQLVRAVMDETGVQGALPVAAKEEVGCQVEEAATELVRAMSTHETACQWEEPAGQLLAVATEQLVETAVQTSMSASRDGVLALAVQELEKKLAEANLKVQAAGMRADDQENRSPRMAVVLSDACVQAEPVTTRSVRVQTPTRMADAFTQDDGRKPRSPLSPVPIPNHDTSKSFYTLSAKPDPLDPLPSFLPPTTLSPSNPIYHSLDSISSEDSFAGTNLSKMLAASAKARARTPPRPARDPLPRLSPRPVPEPRQNNRSGKRNVERGRSRTPRGASSIPTPRSPNMPTNVQSPPPPANRVQFVPKPKPPPEEKPPTPKTRTPRPPSPVPAFVPSPTPPSSTGSLTPRGPGTPRSTTSNTNASPPVPSFIPSPRPSGSSTPQGPRTPSSATPIHSPRPTQSPTLEISPRRFTFDDARSPSPTAQPSAARAFFPSNTDPSAPPPVPFTKPPALAIESLDISDSISLTPTPMSPLTQSLPSPNFPPKPPTPTSPNLSYIEPLQPTPRQDAAPAPRSNSFLEAVAAVKTMFNSSRPASANPTANSKPPVNINPVHVAPSHPKPTLVSPAPTQNSLFAPFASRLTKLRNTTSAAPASTVTPTSPNAALITLSHTPISSSPPRARTPSPAPAPAPAGSLPNTSPLRSRTPNPSKRTPSPSISSSAPRPAPPGPVFGPLTAAVAATTRMFARSATPSHPSAPHLQPARPTSRPSPSSTFFPPPYIPSRSPHPAARPVAESPDSPTHTSPHPASAPRPTKPAHLLAQAVANSALDVLSRPDQGLSKGSDDLLFTMAARRSSSGVSKDSGISKNSSTYSGAATPVARSPLRPALSHSSSHPSISSTLSPSLLSASPPPLPTVASPSSPTPQLYTPRTDWEETDQPLAPIQRSAPHNQDWASPHPAPRPIRTFGPMVSRSTPGKTWGSETSQGSQPAHNPQPSAQASFTTVDTPSLATPSLPSDPDTRPTSPHTDHHQSDSRSGSSILPYLPLPPALLTASCPHFPDLHPSQAAYLSTHSTDTEYAPPTKRRAPNPKFPLPPALAAPLSPSYPHLHLSEEITYYVEASQTPTSPNPETLDRYFQTLPSEIAYPLKYDPDLTLDDLLPPQHRLAPLPPTQTSLSDWQPTALLAKDLTTTPQPHPLSASPQSPGTPTRTPARVAPPPLTVPSLQASSFPSPGPHTGSSASSRLTPLSESSLSALTCLDASIDTASSQSDLTESLAHTLNSPAPSHGTLTPRTARSSPYTSPKAPPLSVSSPVASPNRPSSITSPSEPSPKILSPSSLRKSLQDLTAAALRWSGSSAATLTEPEGLPPSLQPHDPNVVTMYGCLTVRTSKTEDELNEEKARRTLAAMDGPQQQRTLWQRIKTPSGPGAMCPDDEEEHLVSSVEIETDKEADRYMKQVVPYYHNRRKKDYTPPRLSLAPISEERTPASSARLAPTTVAPSTAPSHPQPAASSAARDLHLDAYADVHSEITPCPSEHCSMDDDLGHYQDPSYHIPLDQSFSDTEWPLDAPLPLPKPLHSAAQNTPAAAASGSGNSTTTVNTTSTDATPTATPARAAAASDPNRRSAAGGSDTSTDGDSSNRLNASLGSGCLASPSTLSEHTDTTEPLPPSEPAELLELRLPKAGTTSGEVEIPPEISARHSAADPAAVGGEPQAAMEIPPEYIMGFMPPALASKAASVSSPKVVTGFDPELAAQITVEVNRLQRADTPPDSLDISLTRDAGMAHLPEIVPHVHSPTAQMMPPGAEPLVFTPEIEAEVLPAAKETAAMRIANDIADKPKLSNRALSTAQMPLGACCASKRTSPTQALAAKRAAPEVAVAVAADTIGASPAKAHTPGLQQRLHSTAQMHLGVCCPAKRSPPGKLVVPETAARSATPTASPVPASSPRIQRLKEQVQARLSPCMPPKRSPSSSSRQEAAAADALVAAPLVAAADSNATSRELEAPVALQTAMPEQAITVQVPLEGTGASTVMAPSLEYTDMPPSPAVSPAPGPSAAAAMAAAADGTLPAARSSSNSNRSAPKPPSSEKVRLPACLPSKRTPLPKLQTPTPPLSPSTSAPSPTLSPSALWSRLRRKNSSTPTPASPALPPPPVYPPPSHSLPRSLTSAPYPPPSHSLPRSLTIAPFPASLPPVNTAPQLALPRPHRRRLSYALEPDSPPVHPNELICWQVTKSVSDFSQCQEESSFTSYVSTVSQARPGPETIAYQKAYLASLPTNRPAAHPHPLPADTTAPRDVSREITPDVPSGLPPAAAPLPLATNHFITVWSNRLDGPVQLQSSGFVICYDLPPSDDFTPSATPNPSTAPSESSLSHGSVALPPIATSHPSHTASHRSHSQPNTPLSGTMSTASTLFPMYLPPMELTDPTAPSSPTTAAPLASAPPSPVAAPTLLIPDAPTEPATSSTPSSDPSHPQPYVLNWVLNSPTPATDSAPLPQPPGTLTATTAASSYIEMPFSPPSPSQRPTFTPPATPTLSDAPRTATATAASSLQGPSTPSTPPSSTRAVAPPPVAPKHPSESSPQSPPIPFPNLANPGQNPPVDPTISPISTGSANISAASHLVLPPVPPADGWSSSNNSPNTDSPHPPTAPALPSSQLEAPMLSRELPPLPPSASTDALLTAPASAAAAFAAAPLEPMQGPPAPPMPVGLATVPQAPPAPEAFQALPSTSTAGNALAAPSAAAERASLEAQVLSPARQRMAQLQLVVEETMRIGMDELEYSSDEQYDEQEGDGQEAEYEYHDDEQYAPEYQQAGSSAAAGPVAAAVNHAAGQSAAASVGVEMRGQEPDDVAAGADQQLQKAAVPVEGQLQKRGSFRAAAASAAATTPRKVAEWVSKAKSKMTPGKNGRQ